MNTLMNLSGILSEERLFVLYALFRSALYFYGMVKTRRQQQPSNPPSTPAPG